MTRSLDEVLTARREDDGLDVLDVATGFGQGKATFGGLIVGACVRSLEARVSDPSRRLRSITAQLVGAPQPGPAHIHIRPLRSSNTVTTLTADLEQGGTVMAHVVGVFATDRPVELTWRELRPPPAPPWRELEPIDPENPFAPEFTRNFEFRSSGGVPYTGSSDAPVGYIRPRAPCARRDAAYVACLVDAWWLVALCRFEQLRPAATLTYTAELHTPASELPDDEPLLHVGRGLVCHAGYSLETRELWSVDGRLVATGTQVVTIIK
ncbi:MAG: thioesterase family protein [Myxococcaceae bacterium]|jgi:acyl-CoA thioesterase|nr:thioesterase family protein [Myxococcaceae bacterium]